MWLTLNLIGSFDLFNILYTPNAKTLELIGIHRSNASHSTRLIVVIRPSPNTKLVIQFCTAL